MNEGTISLIVIAAFLIILVTGFLVGLGRGFNKSLVRILLMAASIVGAFFLAPVVSAAIINMDISGFGINVGGDTVSSLGELLRALLNQVPAMQDITGTEAFATIMAVVPQMIVNIVMFILLFYIIRLVTLIIYWIIAGIAFSKKKTEGKNKHRLLGSLVGVVQNFLVFVVLLIPVYGTINLVAQVEQIITEETESGSSTAATTLSEETGYSVLMTEEEPESSAAEDTIVRMLAKVNEIVDVCKNTWVMKTLGAIKVDVLCDSVFTKLSTVEKDGEKYVLKDEVTSIAPLYKDYKNLIESGFDITNDDSIAAIKSMVNHCFASKLTANMINEVVPIAVDRWNHDQPFCGISKPHVEGFDTIITTMLNELATAANEGKLQSVIASSLDVAKSAMKAAKAMEEAAGSIASIDAETIGELLTELTSDPALMEIAEKVVVDNIDTITEQIFGEEDTNGYGAALKEVVETIFDGDYTEDNTIADEIAVVEKALDVVQTIGSDEELTQDDANELMQVLSDSSVIYDMLTSTDDSTGDNNSAVAEVIRNTIGDNAEIKNVVADAINSLSAGEDPTAEELETLQAKKEALAAAFGVDISMLP